MGRGGGAVQARGRMGQKTICGQFARVFLSRQFRINPKVS